MIPTRKIVMLCGLLWGTMGILACSEPPCGSLQEGTLQSSDMADESSFCAYTAITEEERKEGLLAYPPLKDHEALLIIFPIEGEVCITTEELSYAIDVIFINEQGDVVETGCDRGPQDPLLCVDGVKEVLETLPQPDCEQHEKWSALK